MKLNLNKIIKFEYTYDTNLLTLFLLHPVDNMTSNIK